MIEFFGRAPASRVGLSACIFAFVSCKTVSRWLPGSLQTRQCSFVKSIHAQPGDVSIKKYVALFIKGLPNSLPTSLYRLAKGIADKFGEDIAAIPHATFHGP